MKANHAVAYAETTWVGHAEGTGTRADATLALWNARLFLAVLLLLIALFNLALLALGFLLLVRVSNLITHHY